MKKPRHGEKTDPRRLTHRITELQEQSKEMATLLSDYHAAIELAASNLTDTTYSSLLHTLIHGDLQPANILMDENGIAAFVDLDWCMWLPRIYDLSFALICCCAERETAFDGSDIWSMTQPFFLRRERLRRFLTVYERYGERLSEIEKRALGPQLILAWCEMRIDGAFKVQPGRRLEFIQREPLDISGFFSQFEIC